MDTKELVWNIQSNRNHHTDTVIVRIDGKDYVVTNVSSAYDGVIGNNIVIDVESITNHV